MKGHDSKEADSRDADQARKSRLENENKADTIKRSSRNGNAINFTDVAGFFLGKDKLLYIRHFDDSSVRERVISSQDQVWSGPLVVLTGPNTFNMGEVFAAALQADGRAKLLGQFLV